MIPWIGLKINAKKMKEDSRKKFTGKVLKLKEKMIIIINKWYRKIKEYLKKKS